MRRLFATLILSAAVLGGCAAIEKSEARSAEDVMTASGFKQIPANTPARVHALQTMKPRTFSIVTKNGVRYWVYPDPTNCGCLFAGTESQYQQYKKTVIQENIAEEEEFAAEDAADFDWGMWGPW